MTKDKYVISKTKRYPYYILMFAILIWFVAMEIFGTNERMIDMSADSSHLFRKFYLAKARWIRRICRCTRTLFHSRRRDYDSHDDTSR